MTADQIIEEGRRVADMQCGHVASQLWVMKVPVLDWNHLPAKERDDPPDTGLMAELKDNGFETRLYYLDEFEIPPDGVCDAAPDHPFFQDLNRLYLFTCHFRINGIWSNSTMQRAYRYRFYPTLEQKSLLRRTVGCCRFVYNRALALRQEAWTQRREKLSGYDLIKKITDWKKDPETEWLKEVSSVPLQQAVNNLEVAYQNFFAKRAKYPAFKKKSAGGSCRFTECGFRIKNGEVWLAKTKSPLDIRWSRPLPEGAAPKQCTVRLTASDEWYISFLCEVEIEKLPPVEKRVGIDMGITALVTTSDGEKVANHKPAQKYRRRLATMQRHAARKQKDSKRRLRAKRKVARIHDKISETRKDQLHKLTARLVRENQTIVVEDLAVRNMLKNHCLAGSISDAGWSLLRSMLEYKCRWYGRELKVIDRWFPSSKTCHGCGHVVEKLPLHVRSWTCPRCGVDHDRDVNAAINILSAGTVDYTDGGIVRPKRTKSVKADPSEVGILGLKAGERSSVS